MSLDLVLLAAALLLGILAALAGRRAPPALDAERLLRQCWSALLWGEAERAGPPPGGPPPDESTGAVPEGREAAWVEAVGRGVLYHPAGREGWAKLADPAAWAIPVPSLPGERALLEDLARLEPGLPRFERLFRCDAAQEALLDDPRGLGPAWEPEGWLGHGCTWEGIAAWSPEVRAALGRRLDRQRLVVLGDEAALAEAGGLLAAAGEEVPATALAQDGRDPSAGAEALASRLLDLLPAPADRLLLAALGDVGPAALAALACSPALRDRCSLVLLVGCPLAGVPGEAPPGLGVPEREAWLRERFEQESFDTELRRSTPYALLARLRPEASPPGDGRVPWERQRVAEPARPRSGRRPVAVIDLGASPAEAGALAPSAFARGLLLLFAFLLGPGAPRA